MGVEQIDYAAILADLEARRNALDATIQSIHLLYCTIEPSFMRHLS